MKHVAACMISLCVGFSGCSPTEHSAPLPQISQIKRIHVDWQQPIRGESPSDGQFDVTDHFAEFIDAVTPNKVEPAPLKWEGVGHFNIELVTGHTIDFNLYWPPREEIVMKTAGVYYVGGSKEKLSQWLRDRSGK